MDEEYKPTITIQDIESLGWKQRDKKTMVFEMSVKDHKNKYQLTTLYTNLITIYYCIDEAVCIGNIIPLGSEKKLSEVYPELKDKIGINIGCPKIRFRGIVKDKLELKKIMEQVI